jgi:addiction module HigA family antidote
MHNPPHPGEFISDVYLKPNNLSARELASKLDVAASTLHRILIGKSGVSPEMALHLSGVRPKVGWQCNTAMTCGRRSNA